MTKLSTHNLWVSAQVGNPKPATPGHSEKRWLSLGETEARNLTFGKQAFLHAKSEILGQAQNDKPSFPL
jgi:hypothetical protein